MVANQGIGPFPSFLSVMLIGCQGCAGTNTAQPLPRASPNNARSCFCYNLLRFISSRVDSVAVHYNKAECYERHRPRRLHGKTLTGWNTCMHLNRFSTWVICNAINFAHTPPL